MITTEHCGGEYVIYVKGETIGTLRKYETGNWNLAVTSEFAENVNIVLEYFGFPIGIDSYSCLHLAGMGLSFWVCPEKASNLIRQK